MPPTPRPTRPPVPWLAARGLAPLALALALASPAAAEPVGFVAGLAGTVEIERGAGTSWTAARLDQDVEIGDSVRTGADSAVKIVLVDDTTLSLGEDTELVIDSLLVGAAATREPSVLRHVRGQIRTRVGEAFGGTTRIEMHTPTAVMGVKGTVFASKIDLLDGELHTLGCNFEGHVFIRFLEDPTSWDIPLARCRRAFADRVEAPIAPPVDFVPVRSPSAGTGPERVAELLFDPEIGPDGGVDGWVGATGLPPVAAGPEGAGAPDLGAAIPGESVFEGREDVVGATGASLPSLADPGLPIGDFPIGGGETPRQP